MKKIIAVLLVAVLGLGLVGCTGVSQPPAVEVDAPAAVETPEPDATSEPASEPEQELDLLEAAEQAGLIQSRRVPQRPTARVSAVDIEILPIFYSSDIIHTTTGAENGLIGLVMYVTGIVDSFEEVEDALSVLIETEYGKIALLNSRKLGYGGEETLTSDEDWELMKIGEEFGFFFSYLGFSSNFNLPVGFFLNIDIDELDLDLPAIEEVEPTPTPAATLIGTWIWEGIPYYVFETGGRGTIADMAMRWTTRGSILSVCNTPDSCGNNCLVPKEWSYVLDGNRLTLTSTILPDMTYNYTRR